MSIVINGTTGISGVDGSAGTPALQGGDPDTGIFYGTNTVSIATNGVAAVTVDASGNTTFAAQTLFPDGSVSAPAISNTGDTNCGIYFPAADTVSVATSGTQAIQVNSSQQLEISDGTVSLPALTNIGDTNTGIYFPAADNVAIATGGVAAVTVDSNQNVGIGVTPSTWSLGKAIEINTVGNSIWATSTACVMGNNFYYNGGYKFAGTGYATSYIQSTGAHSWSVSTASGTAGNAITFTGAMTLDSSGNLLVGTTSSAGLLTVVSSSTTVGTRFAAFSDANTRYSGFFQGADGTTFSATNTCLGVRSITGTGRSINASGTINASGADYAEYMTKSGDFTINKGDICGIDANGKLTNVFAHSLSFVVKSTNPSYVGGDIWGNEEAIGLTKPEDNATDEDKAEFYAILEAARHKVDRIAFAGQVPVNVTGADAGDYIIPEDDNGSIKGIAVSNPTFEQYKLSVGKVISIEEDGRAKIIVKVS